jgi:hypothetical protein
MTTQRKYVCVCVRCGVVGSVFEWVGRPVDALRYRYLARGWEKIVIQPYTKTKAQIRQNVNGQYYHRFKTLSIRVIGTSSVYLKK